MILDLEGSVPDLLVGFMSVLMSTAECRQDLIMAYSQVTVCWDYTLLDNN